MDGSQDRRRNVRTQVLLKVEYHEPRDLLSDYLTDLAEGGLFIRTDAPFEIGQQIAFDVSFPGLLDPLSMNGIVRWRQSSKPDSSTEAVGVGVEFVFESPQQRQRIAQLVASFEEPPAPAIEESPKPFKVLLVEDNEFVHDLFRHGIRKFYREMNDSGTLEIVGAKTGQEALACIDSTAIDLAIVDHFLPVMTGTDLIQKLRGNARHKNIPILMVSVGGDGVREEALAAGADLYLDKPVLLKQLLTTLRLLISKRQMVNDLAGACATTGGAYK